MRAPRASFAVANEARKDRHPRSRKHTDRGGLLQSRLIQLEVDVNRGLHFHRLAVQQVGPIAPLRHGVDRSLKQKLRPLTTRRFSMVPVGRNGGLQLDATGSVRGARHRRVGRNYATDQHAFHHARGDVPRRLRGLANDSLLAPPQLSGSHPVPGRPMRGRNRCAITSPGIDGSSAMGIQVSVGIMTGPESCLPDFRR